MQFWSARAAYWCSADTPSTWRCFLWVVSVLCKNLNHEVSGIVALSIVWIIYEFLAWRNFKWLADERLARLVTSVSGSHMSFARLRERCCCQESFHPNKLIYFYQSVGGRCLKVDYVCRDLVSLVRPTIILARRASAARVPCIGHQSGIAISEGGSPIRRHLIA